MDWILFAVLLVAAQGEPRLEITAKPYPTRVACEAARGKIASHTRLLTVCERSKRG